MNDGTGNSVVRDQQIGPAAENPYGHIRSFVLRQGRVSSAQQRYYEDMMPKIGVPYAAAPLDLDALFGRSSQQAPKIFEIGCGMGEDDSVAMLKLLERMSGVVGA